MKKLLLAALLLIPVLAFSGCMALQKPMDNMMGINPKTGCSYGVNCSQIPGQNKSATNN
jgi:hypothetical protein